MSKMIKNTSVKLIILFCFLSCISDFKYYQKSQNNILLHYYIHDTINRTDSIFLDKVELGDSIKYLYRTLKDTFHFSFEKNLKNDSYISIYGAKCPLVSTKNITIDKNTYKINKYYYDIENSQDEETSFFINDTYGLLIDYNDGWLDLIFTIEYDSISKILIDRILIDTTGFYKRFVPPPPSLDYYLNINIEEY